MIMAVEAIDEDNGNTEGESVKMTMSHFVKGGVASAVVGWLVVVSVGYTCALGVMGVPPVHIIIKAPEALKPTVERWDETRAAEARINDLEQKLGRRLEELESNYPSSYAPSDKRTDWGQPDVNTDDRAHVFTTWGLEPRTERLRPPPTLSVW